MTSDKRSRPRLTVTNTAGNDWLPLLRWQPSHLLHWAYYLRNKMILKV